MGFAYVARDQFAVHYVTFTVHQWVDVFTRQIYRDMLIESINYCIKEKGLEVFSWVIMSNHCHLIIRSTTGKLSDTIRDLKKFTSKKIYKAIQDNPQESRKNWLLLTLYKDGIWFWEEGYHGEEIYSESFFQIKANYIHQNPVRAGIVEKEEEYLYCSAGDFYGIRNGYIPISSF